MATSDATRIDEPQIERDARGKITAVRFAFGPHHFVEVWVEDGKVRCAIGTTNHGIQADASEVNSELEKLIHELKQSHPNSAF